jgi:hypothetical protein
MKNYNSRVMYSKNGSAGWRAIGEYGCTSFTMTAKK